jgi:hypothetical protein
MWLFRPTTVRERIKFIQGRTFTPELILCRPVIGPSGGLCGLASLYQALENTIYSVSQLTQFTYAGMRATIAEEMGINSTATATLSDSDLLDQFYACKLDSNKKCIYKSKKLPKPKHNC